MSGKRHHKATGRADEELVGVAQAAQEDPLRAARLRLSASLAGHTEHHDLAETRQLPIVLGALRA
eukprot:15454660-Alexandrium_andersonii.AAC.1